MYLLRHSTRRHDEKSVVDFGVEGGSVLHVSRHQGVGGVVKANS